MLINLLNVNDDIKFGFQLAQLTSLLLNREKFNIKVKKQYRELIKEFLNSFNAIYFFEEDRIKIIGYLNYN